MAGSRGTEGRVCCSAFVHNSPGGSDDIADVTEAQGPAGKSPVQCQCRGWATCPVGSLGVRSLLSFRGLPRHFSRPGQSRPLPFPKASPNACDHERVRAEKRTIAELSADIHPWQVPRAALTRSWATVSRAF